MSQDLPPLALSVRQPWAWAIIHGGKSIENRTAGAIRSGGMDCRTIAIHAATGMRRKEYDWAVWRMAQDGVKVPHPAQLIRGAIIGTVDVVDIITESDSPWFGGPCGLVLENPRPCAPVPSKGALGYFAWTAAKAMAPPVPWMRTYGQINRDGATGDLFADAPIMFQTPPEKPFGSSKPKTGDVTPDN